MDCIRQTLVASRAVGFEKCHGVTKLPALDGSEVNYSPMSYKELFHLATQGSADALSCGDIIGNFKIGKHLDCLVVDPEAAGGPIDIFPDEDIMEKFQKFLFLGDDRNIEHIFVDGMEVSGDL